MKRIYEEIQIMYAHDKTMFPALKTVTLVLKFLKIGFPRYFAAFVHLKKILYNTRSVRILVVSWWFLSFNHQFARSVNILATALHLMLPPCGMLYMMTFKQLHLLPYSGEGSKHTSTTMHTLHNLH